MPLHVNAIRTFFEEGEAVGCVAVGAIPAGRAVKITTGGLVNQPHVTLCGAGDQPDFVSAWDAVDGEIFTCRKGGIREVRVGASAVTAGTLLSTGAAGVFVAQASTAPFVATALADTAANGLCSVNLKGPLG